MTHCHFRESNILRKILALLIASTICIDTLRAQNVAPAITDPVALAKVQEQRDAVFKKMFADPTNLTLLFEYANLSILVGDLEAAIGVFEQPQDHPLKWINWRIQTKALGLWDQQTSF